MSESLETLRRKMTSADELQSVVRTMKTLAASNIAQFERSVKSLADYYRTVELGLSVCFRATGVRQPLAPTRPPKEVASIVFGSDQGLVGQFNDVIADAAVTALSKATDKPSVWAIGERVRDRLSGAGIPIVATFPVPNSLKAITPLVNQIQLQMEARPEIALGAVYVFHNRTTRGAMYEPATQRLLPLDEEWRRGLAKVPWPNAHLPEVMGRAQTLSSLVREYLFISLYRACAESLAAENASRLAAMERAEKNIKDLRENLNGEYNRLRQASIDEELFDVVAGFEALAAK